MGGRKKFIVRILSGTSDNNILFDEMIGLMNYLNFSIRINGSHHIFYRDDIEEIINIQPKNGKVKAYQVKHIRNILVKYKLGGKC